jgi:hypothetical protein
VVKQFLIWSLAVIASVMSASTASASTLTTPKTVLLISTSKTIPSCVQANQRISIRLRFKSVNTDFPLLVTARLAYVAKSIKTADQNSVIIAPGTDKLLGGLGDKHWSFGLLPGQTKIKHLVLLVQPAMDQKTSPPKWGFSMMISLAGSNRTGWVRVARPYC